MECLHAAFPLYRGLLASQGGSVSLFSLCSERNGSLHGAEWWSARSGVKQIKSD